MLNFDHPTMDVSKIKLNTGEQFLKQIKIFDESDYELAFTQFSFLYFHTE